jgi:hypothetical protein
MGISIESEEVREGGEEGGRENGRTGSGVVFLGSLSRRGRYWTRSTCLLIYLTNNSRHHSLLSLLPLFPPPFLPQGYYPRIFYPGLYNVKERMLKNFEPVFYLKPAQGGFIFRKYPEEWQQVLTYYDFREQLRGVRRDGGTEKKKEVFRKVVMTTRERPAYNDVVNVLKKESARMGREAQEAQEEEQRVEAAEREARRRR